MIVEVLKDGRPAAMGERGEVVGTNLHFAMPFIRYRLGDIVTKDPRPVHVDNHFPPYGRFRGDERLLPTSQGRMIHPDEIIGILQGPVDSRIPAASGTRGSNRLAGGAVC